MENDMMIEILSYLPGKSLLRFKSVCKAWQGIILSSDFIKLHLNRSLRTNSNNSLFVVARFWSSGSVYGIRNLHNTTNLARTFRIVLPPAVLRSRGYNEFKGSCNGLLLIHYRIVRYYFAIYNPTTRASFTIPLPPCSRFDRSWGFGYDSYSDEYKIVGLPKTNDHPVLVYSLKSNLWIQSMIDNLDYSRKPPYSISGVLASNRLHWHVQIGVEKAGLVENNNAILSFDLRDDKWKVVPLPCILERINYCKIGVFEECLGCLFKFFNGCPELWIMKEYGIGESWTKLFTLPQRYFSIPFLCRRQEEGYEYLLRGIKGLVWYDPHRQTVKSIDVDGELDGKQDFHNGKMLMCVESLANPFPVKDTARKRQNRKRIREHMHRKY